MANPSPNLSDPRHRTSRDALLHREVRWRLFSREELPARLRRLERLERAADGAPGPGRAEARPQPGERPGSID
jgi:hypothetical protein